MTYQTLDGFTAQSVHTRNFKMHGFVILDPAGYPFDFVNAKRDGDSVSNVTTLAEAVTIPIYKNTTKAAYAELEVMSLELEVTSSYFNNLAADVSKPNLTFLTVSPQRYRKITQAYSTGKAS
jgi:hypothetical protein